ncbi:hypothetical protein GCM10027594_27630 [Hymenobacter agri]
MAKLSTASVLTAGLSLLAGAAQAQATFRVGPTVGYNLAFGGFDYPNQTYLKVSNTARSGVEAGVVAQLGFGGHFAVQPAVLYSQKGFGFTESAYDAAYNYTYKGEYTFRFDYLAVPVNAVYSQEPGGRGLLVFGGPYVGFLLGGRYTSAQSGSYGGGGSTRSQSDAGKVEAGDTYNNRPGQAYVSRGTDVGLQGGLGYGFANGLQLQVGYSQGLRNLGAAYAPGVTSQQPPTYRNHAVQLSLAYLFGGVH